MCTSLIDYIFRNLAVNYLGRDDLAHVPPSQALQPDTMGEPKYERERELAAAPVMLTTTPIDVNEPGLVTEDTEEVMVRDTYRTTGAVSSRPAVLSTHGVEHEAASQPHLDLETLARAGGYLGTPCAECHELKLVQNGSCAKCANCGTTTGCS
jgi:ribonucleoside-diphosphate reductase alpha chain